MANLPRSRELTQGNASAILRRNKENAIAFYSTMVNEQDPVRAFETYAGSTYRQHNPTVVEADGREAFLKHFFELNKSEPHQERFLRAIAEGDLVALHVLHQNMPRGYTRPVNRPNEYEEYGLVSMDIFRFDDCGRIVEHWNALQWPPSPYLQPGTAWDQTHWCATGWPEPPKARAGLHTMIDGATAIRDLDQTETNRSLVVSFVDMVLVGGNLARLPGYFDEGRCIQHDPYMTDGAAAYSAGLSAMTRTRGLEYRQLHRTIAEGNFVFTQCEGAYRGRTTVIMDLYRVEQSRIAEHWDVFWEAVPEKLARNNTLF